MHIVHIEDFFHPDAGYQLNVLTKYQARQGNKVTIVTSVIEKSPEYLLSFFSLDNIKSKDANFEKENNVKIERVAIYGFYSGRAIFKEKVFTFINALKPDVLFVHNNASYIGIRYTLKQSSLSYPIVYDCHMLKMASQNRFSSYFEKLYKKFITPKLINQGAIVFKVVKDNYLQEYLGIPANQCPFLPLATDELHFQYDEKKRIEIRKKFNIPLDAFVVVYAGKLNESKGALLLAKALEKKIQLKDKDLYFLIIGSTAKNEFGLRVENLFTSSINNVIRLDTQTYSFLPDYYSAADCAVYPRQCSMSFFDVQSIGLPVLLENIPINVERLKHGNGLLFESDSEESLRHKILSISEMEENDFETMSQNAKNFVLKSSASMTEVSNNLNETLTDLIQGFKNK